MAFCGQTPEKLWLLPDCRSKLGLPETNILPKVYWGGGGQFSILAVSVFGCINFSEWHREQSSSMPQVLVWVSSTVTHPLCCTVGALLPQFLQDLPPAHPSTASLTNPCAAACLELQTYHAQGAWPWPLGTHHSPRGPHPEGLTE